MPFQFRRGTMKSEKSSARLSDIGVGGILRILARFLQFVMALAVCGLYGQDLNHARMAHKYADSKWVYAVICGGLSAASAVVFMVPIVKAWFFFAWDAVLFILWMTLFGIFGKMYIKEDAEGDAGIVRMKHAVWVDLVNMLLWFMTAVYGAVIFWKARKARTLHTGAAPVHA